MPPESGYYIADGSALDDVIERIRTERDHEEIPVHEVRRTFLDSFDWRLYAGRVRLWIEQKDGQTALYQNGIPKYASDRRFAATETIPTIPEDLPEGSVRDRISRLLEMRALLPQVEIRSRVRGIHLLDEEKKVVLRIMIEESACKVPGKGDYRGCGSRLILRGVKGYPQPLAENRRLIGKQPGLSLTEKGLFEDALDALGRVPCSYSSKISFRFDPAMRSDLAAREIHLHLLDIIEVNLPGVKANLDSEFLHDMRVAVRRIRSALSQIKGVFNAGDLDRFKTRMAWVGQVTGPTRDMDVYLLGFDRYRTNLPERFRDDLEPLHAFLESHRMLEHGVMVKKINSPHFRSLMKEFRAFLLEAPGEQNTAPEAATPVSELASKRIYKMYCRVLRDGQAIDDDSPAKDLHELRKECKKLRYLMEFFQSLYPENKIMLMIKSLKQLLDNLGNFQDLEVQADKLRDYARRMVEEGETPHDTLLAMGMLVDGLLTRQQLARAEFSDRFAAFSQPANQKTFRSLFAPTKKQG